MLLKLHIRNFALIDDLDVEFDSGLNVLTGETGAGKSIIIDAINLIVGQRASSKFIRTGKQQAEVEAIFKFNDKNINKILKEYGVESEDVLIINRQITNQGRNYCRLNGKSVPLLVLKKVSKYLVDIHGQNSHQSLFNQFNHKKLLDMFGGKDIVIAKNNVKKTFKRYKKFKEQTYELLAEREKLHELRSKLEYEIKEIENANIQPDEDKQLEEQRNILQNAEKIFLSLESAYDLLYKGQNVPSILDNLNKVIANLQDIESFYDKIGSVIDFLKNTLYELEDVAETLRNYKDCISFDASKLDSIQSRIDYLDRLKAKYNMNLSELLEYKNLISGKLNKSIALDEKVTNLKQKLNNETDKLIKHSTNLHNIRKKAALKLQEAIAIELSDLGMKNVKFYVDIKLQESIDGIKVNNKKVKITHDGFDNIEFLISTNLGEPLKPLSKIVSGGEASRIMLALKSILAKVDKIPCLIFDEIDAGIGGRTAQIVGEKLSLLAKTHQVLCVTHSPQIASIGDTHYLIKKQILGNSTYTNIYKLDSESRIKELARMLGGAKITENTINHAKEMLNMVKIRE